ncbi:MAG: serine/threonine-protein kinase [Polyangiaceae bacterium]
MANPPVSPNGTLLTPKSSAGTADTLVGTSTIPFGAPPPRPPAPPPPRRAVATALMPNPQQPEASPAPPPAAAESADLTIPAGFVFSQTIDAASVPNPQSHGAVVSTATVSSASPPSIGRTTLGVLSALPRVEISQGRPQLVHDGKPRFEELRVLGQGGMGEVALVHDEDIDRTVAVKRLHPDIVADTVSDHATIAVARFVEEVRTVGRLEHPNIVPLHDVGLDAQGRFYFVMKYVEGEDLETVIEKLAAGDPAYEAQYTYEVRVQIFISLLRALEYAHAKGILHRDIKPANVMIGRYGEVVLMDWGIAKSVGTSSQIDAATSSLPAAAASKVTASRTHQTAVGALLGTPAYMSPEQARGENDKLDIRSDLYSACALFYELMVLRHYIHPEPQSLDELLMAIRERPLPPVFDVRAHTSERGVTPPIEYLHFLHQGLEKDPAARYQSAREMVERLQQVIDGRVPVQCPVTLTKRVTRESGRFVDRHPIVGVAAFAGVVLLALWSVTITLLWMTS